MIQRLQTAPHATLPAPNSFRSGDLTTGACTLDEDHQLLLSVVNHLHDAVLAGFEERGLRPLLHRLITHAQLHFDREEKFFQQTQSHAAAALKGEHIELLRQLLEVQSGFEVSSALTLQNIDFLQRRFVVHIQHIDSRCAPFLRSARW